MNKKTKRPKKTYALEAKIVAEITGVCESTVKKVRTAETSGASLNTDNAKVIQLIDVYAEQNKSKFIQELKRLVIH